MEIRKKLKDFDFDYWVNQYGIVLKSNKGVIKKLNTYDNGLGYKMVSLKINGKYKLYYVHRLVANSFINNDLNLSEINHIDFDKSNNCASNLEWCTRVYNVRHYHSKSPSISYKKSKRKLISYIKEWYCIDFYKYTNKWRLRINSKGTRKHIGYFKTYEDALNKEKMLSL